MGTSSVKGVLFDRRLRPKGEVSRRVATRTAESGIAEQDPRAVARACRWVLRQLAATAHPVAIGLCTHRSSCVWIDEAGRFCSDLVLWSDRRATRTAAALAATPAGERIVERSGLPVLPYLFGVRARHLLATRPPSADRLVTADAALVAHLTGGAAIATDPSMTARTLLADPDTGRYDDELLELLGVPRSVLAPVQDSVGVRGEVRVAGRSVPIAASLADQSAAHVGVAVGDGHAVTLTFGTGLFAVRGGGRAAGPGVFPLILESRRGRARRGWETNDPSTGAAVETFGRILSCSDAVELERVARRAVGGGEVVVPSVSGLGAPYLRPPARAGVFGVSTSTGRAELARAVLEGVGARAAELLATLGGRGPVIAAGGGSRSDLTLQAVADRSGRDVSRSMVVQAGARGRRPTGRRRGRVDR